MNYTREEVEKLSESLTDLEWPEDHSSVVRKLAEDWKRWDRDVTRIIPALSRSVDDAACAANDIQRAIDVLKMLP